MSEQEKGNLEEMNDQEIAEETTKETERVVVDSTDDLDEKAAATEQKPAKEKKKLSTGFIAHLCVDAALVITICVLTFFGFTTAGKMIQEYGFETYSQAKSLYDSTAWGENKGDFETFFEYYEYYGASFDEYADEYAEMGINSVEDLMNAVYDDYAAYNAEEETSDTDATDETEDSEESDESDDSDEDAKE